MGGTGPHIAHLLTADHKLVAEKDTDKHSVDFDRVALVILDFLTHYLDAFPARSKNADETSEEFR